MPLPWLFGTLVANHLVCGIFFSYHNYSTALESVNPYDLQIFVLLERHHCLHSSGDAVVVVVAISELVPLPYIILPFALAVNP